MSRNNELEPMATLFSLLIVFALIALFSLPRFFFCDTVNFKVEEKLVKRSDESDRYLIMNDKEVFVNEDSWIGWKFNSSDQYARLKVNKCYRAKVHGVRIQFFSMYRNIDSFSEIKCN